jgi:hypothetical protein
LGIENEMKWILTTLCLLGLLGCKPKEEPEPRDHFLRMLSFPTVPLAEGERISGLQIDMACGRFRAVNRIPNDWSLEIEGPVSERSTLKAVANHGASWLSNSSNLQGFATILVCSTSHFDISATVFTEASDNEGKKTFSRDQLKLDRAPNHAPHGICR